MYHFLERCRNSNNVWFRALMQSDMNCSVVSVLTNPHYADCVYVLYALSRVFAKGTVRYLVWTLGP